MPLEGRRGRNLIISSTRTNRHIRPGSSACQSSPLFVRTLLDPPSPFPAPPPPFPDPPSPFPGPPFPFPASPPPFPAPHAPFPGPPPPFLHFLLQSMCTSSPLPFISSSSLSFPSSSLSLFLLLRTPPLHCLFPPSPCLYSSSSSFTAPPHRFPYTPLLPLFWELSL